MVDVATRTKVKTLPGGSDPEAFDISLADIKAWNPAFRKSSKVRPGQAVVVSKP